MSITFNKLYPLKIMDSIVLEEDLAETKKFFEGGILILFVWISVFFSKTLAN